VTTLADADLIIASHMTATLPTWPDPGSNGLRSAMYEGALIHARFGPGPTHSFRLQSGDALTLGGPARLAFHGVDRVMAGTSTLLSPGGRINLTLRRVAVA